MAAKRAELEEVSALMAREPRLSDRRLLLSQHRDRVAEIRAWPLSLQNLARVGLYLVIPPLAWTAADLVENWVSRFY